MRLRLACTTVLVLASSATAAPAELALGDIQLELGPRHDFLADEDSEGDELVMTGEPYYRYAAFAQLTGGGHGNGDVGTGASAAIAGLGCDFAAGTAQGRLRFDSTFAGEATYSLCLSRVLLTAVFDGRRGVGVEPALDARRSLWAQHYNETYDRIEIGFGEVWWQRQNRHTLAMIALGHGTLEQADRTVKTLDIDFTLYRYRRVTDSTITVEAIVLEGEALKAGADDKGGVAHAFLPVRLRYDTPDHYIVASAGWGFSGGYVTASGSTEVNGKTTSSWSETIDSTGLPQMTIPIGDLEAGMRRDRVEWSAKVGRTFYPTFDGNIAREARVAASVSYTPGRTRRTKLSLSPFAARTRVWTRDAGTSLDTSTGASLYFGRELTRELRVDAIGQAGITPYAQLEGDREGTPSLGGQVLVALSGRVTDLHKLHRHLPR
ncbi:MAG TPA: hypothetical protein VIV11_29025 [Kofleriaceae bacterium]